jgi:hypothetical protein
MHLPDHAMSENRTAFANISETMCRERDRPIEALNKQFKIEKFGVDGYKNDPYQRREQQSLET